MFLFVSVGFDWLIEGEAATWTRGSVGYRFYLKGYRGIGQSCWDRVGALGWVKGKMGIEGGCWGIYRGTGEGKLGLDLMIFAKAVHREVHE